MLEFPPSLPAAEPVHLLRCLILPPRATTEDTESLDSENDCDMPCGKRKRIQCRGSGASRMLHNKKVIAETADCGERRSGRPESIGETADDGGASDSLVPSSSDDTGFSRGSATGVAPSDLGFRSAGGRQFPTGMTSEWGALEMESPGKALDDPVRRAPEMTPRGLKKADPNSPVSNVRSLVSTGLLEGLPVTYHSHSCKMKVNGFVKDLGYLCGCSSCKYTKVLSALQFEKHSGGASKNQNDHILLQSGKSLYSVFKDLARTGLSLGSLDGVIEQVIGCPPNWNCYKAWKESFKIENHGDRNTCQLKDERERSQNPVCTEESRNSAVRRSLVEDAPAMINDTPNERCRGCSSENEISSSPKQLPASPDYSATLSSEEIKGFMSKGRVRVTRGMLRSLDPCNTAESSINHNPKTEPSSPAPACSKRRDSLLHRVIFMEGGLPDGAELAYRVKGQTLLQGYKLGSGIQCNCCLKQISPSQFEAHAGCAKRRQPDEECSSCREGGQLVFCARCPKAFHLDCLSLDHMPDGEWCCRCCNDELSSGVPAPDTQMAVRVRRIIESPSLETGCCSICRRSDFSCNDTFNEETVIICDQCEKEYHVGCLRSSGLCDLQDLPAGNWFCCTVCLFIHDSLRDIAFHGASIVPDAFTHQLKAKTQNECFVAPGFDVRWRLLSGKFPSPANKLLLSKAFEIFNEGFEPIIDRSGQNLIPGMVYSQNMGGHEFGGMCCVVLIVNSIVVSAGIIRVFGDEVAEMPLVATKQEDQGKGYFGCLFSCIKMVLRNLSVKTLVLPAMENVESMWIHKFGFQKMPDERLQNLAAVIPMMTFRGTKMLEKPVFAA